MSKYTIDELCAMLDAQSEQLDAHLNQIADLIVQISLLGKRLDKLDVILITIERLWDNPKHRIEPTDEPLQG